MKNIAVINAISLGRHALLPLVDGASAVDRVTAFARLLPGVQDWVVLLSLPLETSAGMRTVTRDSWTQSDLLAQVVEAAAGFEDVFYFYADCPLLDIELARRMHENHRRYWADYTYADGYPYGLSTEILTRETAGRLKAAASASAPERDTMFSLISKDINAYDIETEISPVDQRLLRVSLSADSQRNFLQLQRVVATGARDAASVCDALQHNPEILRTLPAYFNIQVVERCPHACSYCPYPVFAGDVVGKTGVMPPQRFSELAARIGAFSGDAVISISLWGEPALHPSIYDLIGAVLESPSLRLVVETSGVGWDPSLFARIKDGFQRQPTWIVSLDATKEDLYTRLRGKGFAEALRSAETLLSLFPTSTWVQAVRMKENEDDLEVFYKSWKARTENVIIQKYDPVGGMLADRRVADLSPLKRFPCWHLKRDLSILLDGTVPRCREDVRVTAPLGNAFTEELSAIWERGQSVYRSHIAEQYPGICAACDEYYTYNF